jgi:hypothetical protein
MKNFNYFPLVPRFSYGIPELIGIPQKFQEFRWNFMQFFVIPNNSWNSREFQNRSSSNPNNYFPLEVSII